MQLTFVNPYRMIPRIPKALYALLLGICIAAVVAVAIYVQRPREPAYAGRPLSAWLEEVDKKPRDRDLRLTNALHQMAPQAWPFLVDMLRPRLSEAERTVWVWAKQRGIKTNLKIDQRWRASDAFAVLGSAGSPAIPELILLLGDTNTQNAASSCLGRIGPVAVPPLVTALTNSTPEVRIGVARTLGERFGFYKDETVVVALLQGLHDRDWRVRSACAESLGRVTKKPDLVLPALLVCLKDANEVIRACAAESIRQYDAAAKDTVPILLKLHKDDPDREVRRVAAQAAMWIEQKVDARN